MKVLLIFGGASPEHEVSIRSAKTVYSGLKEHHEVYLCYISKDDLWYHAHSIDDLSSLHKLSYDSSRSLWVGDGEFQVDVAFIIVHGVGGEDGVLQKKLDDWGVTYVGTPACQSEVCFDKVKTKSLLRDSNIPVVEEYVYKQEEKYPDVSQLRELLGEIPYFVKPARSGSSVGVSRVSTETELHEALEEALRYDDKILIERAVTNPRELEVAVLETNPGEFMASVIGEIVTDDGFYSYDSKYSSESRTKTVIQPEDLAEDVVTHARDVALRASTILGVKGLVRVDFLYDTERSILYLNEVNTLPGFTSISMYPMLWEASGVSLVEQLDTMVRVAYER